MIFCRYVNETNREEHISGLSGHGFRTLGRHGGDAFLSVPGYLPFRGRAERRPSPDGKEGREMSGFRRRNLVVVVKFFRDCNCIVT